jgi:hypothetical protein
LPLLEAEQRNPGCGNVLEQDRARGLIQGRDVARRKQMKLEVGLG